MVAKAYVFDVSRIGLIVAMRLERDVAPGEGIVTDFRRVTM
jgi:hypothetical protein